VGLKTFKLKLLTALAVKGEVLRPGAIVELIESEAKNLLQRGKAELVQLEADLGIKGKTETAPPAPPAAPAAETTPTEVKPPADASDASAQPKDGASK
jgi:hypothetical protein